MKHEQKLKLIWLWFRSAIVINFLLAVLYAIPGCHTINGVGQDLQSWAKPAVTNYNAMEK